MKYAVTGGAGFIASHLVDRLLNDGNEVICIDNFVTGKKENIVHNENKKNFKCIVNDLSDIDYLTKIFKGCDAVFHFAANADIRGSIKNTRKDLEVNTILTYNVLEAMRKADVKKIVFASSSAVYGEPEKIPTPEDYPLTVTSLYGASKVAGETLIEAYCSTFDMQGWMYRFVGIIGERYSHGVIYDFVKKLSENPDMLEILGNGNQRKSFLYVKDCADGIMFGYNRAKDSVNIFNLGTDEAIVIRKLADVVVEEMGLKNVEYNFTGGIRGWKGDSPVVRLSTEKINRFGWKPKLKIEEGIRATTRWLINQKHEDKYKSNK
ncbi:MAG: NAD-dependent epimerase/dehydratase family protein [Candidatus Thermoplasmatota archaeon]|nr:NAD-dependent epimerase/dehydratase family protein [Candidatus Thermoplasmatota archaeon]